MKAKKITDMFLGLSLADALGVPVEFKSRDYLSRFPVKTMLEFGTYHQEAGTWSDDSSLTFCLADSLTQGYSLKDMAIKFVKWRQAEVWTPHGKVFDIGIQTNSAIGTLQKILARGDYDSLELLKYETDEYTNGNGSLMRILPLVFHIKGWSTKEQFDSVWQVSALTHGHIRSAISCLIYLKFAEHLINGETIRQAYVSMQRDIKRFFEDEGISEIETMRFTRLIDEDISELEETDIKSGGYVIDTLEASFWCLLTTNSYLESVFKGINLGEDTDTTATVIGGLSGFYYGLNEVPDTWIGRLARKNDIMHLSEQFSKKYGYGH